MSETEIISYLARMEGLTEDQFLKSREKGLKAIDHLRMFYAAAYIAKREI